MIGDNHSDAYRQVKLSGVTTLCFDRVMLAGGWLLRLLNRRVVIDVTFSMSST